MAALVLSLTANEQGGLMPSAPNIEAGIDFNPSSDYPAAGEPFDPAADVLQKLGPYDKAPFIIGVFFERTFSGGHFYDASFDRVAKTLHVFKDGTEAAAHDDNHLILLHGVIVAR